jgi:hypothetical protein
MRVDSVRTVATLAALKGPKGQSSAENATRASSDNALPRPFSFLQRERSFSVRY